MQRRHHCELAFEQHLRRLRLPYIAVDEARKALLPEGSAADSIKSFDFLVSTPDRKLVVDVKGRRLRLTRKGTVGRLENWVTQDDLHSMARWEDLLGAGFEAVFVFAYWSDHQPPDGMFEHLVEYRDRWYALRTVTLRAYERHARIRSHRWETLDLPTSAFDRMGVPLCAPRCA